MVGYRLIGFRFELISRLPGELSYSQLVLTSVRNVAKGEKSVFAMMAGPGLFFGDIEAPPTSSPAEGGRYSRFITLFEQQFRCCLLTLV